MRDNDSSVSISCNFEYTYERLKGRGPTKMLSNEAMRAYLKDGKVTVRAKVSVKMPDDLKSAKLLTADDDDP